MDTGTCTYLFTGFSLVGQSNCIKTSITDHPNEYASTRVKTSNEWNTLNENFTSILHLRLPSSK